VTTHEEAVEIAMHLEDTPGGGETSTILTRVKSHLTNLTMKLQDMVRVVREHVWCTMFQSEGHRREEVSSLGKLSGDGCTKSIYDWALDGMV
jgi:hypothetical protein